MAFSGCDTECSKTREVEEEEMKLSRDFSEACFQEKKGTSFVFTLHPRMHLSIHPWIHFSRVPRTLTKLNLTVPPLTHSEKRNQTGPQSTPSSQIYSAMIAFSCSAAAANAEMPSRSFSVAICSSLKSKRYFASWCRYSSLGISRELASSALILAGTASLEL